MLETYEMRVQGKIPWRRGWQLIPVFLPGKFHGQRGLVGYSPGGCKELDRTEHTHMCSILENVSGALEKNVYSAIFDVQFSSVQSLSRIQLFAIP